MSIEKKIKERLKKEFIKDTTWLAKAKLRSKQFPILIPSKISYLRFDDYEIYKLLCNELNIHESQRKAIFGVDCFYKHYNKLYNEFYTTSLQH